MTTAYRNSTFTNPVLRLIADRLRREQDSRIASSPAYSMTGDGSMNRALQDTEVVHYRFYNTKLKGIVTEFYDIVEVDKSKSKDGKSCDAKAIHETLAASADARVPGSSGRLKGRLVSASYDGANVNLGEHDSLASRLRKEAPNVIIIHAIAHRFELSYHAAYLDVPYMLLIDETVQSVYNIYCQSGKKFDGLAAIADALEQEPVLRFSGLHGIRWMASKHRALEILLRNYPPLVMHAKANALPDGSLTEQSAPSLFMGKRLSVLNSDTSRMVKVAVTAVSADSVAPLQQKFTLTYSNKQTSEHTKEEMVTLLNFHEGLTKNEDWQLYVALTQWEPLAMMHFGLDVEEQLKVLSLVFQTDNIAPTDVENAVGRMTTKVGSLLGTNGTHFAEFLSEYDAVQETWKGISIEKDDGMEVSFNANRVLLVNSVLAHTAARFDSLFKNEIFIASKALEHRRWPVYDDAALRGHGNNEIVVLVKQFSQLECMTGFDMKEAMHQWERLKFETRSMEFFKSTTYMQFWEHLAAHFDRDITGYSEILKVAILVLLIITDSSCCERSYSLMNRIHTFLRNRLGVGTVRDLMCVSSLGPDVKEYDPKPVLKDWLDAGKRNRSLSIVRRQLIGRGADGDDDDDGDED